jgi:hypothetical protein
MFKKFVNGLLFGAGLGVSLVAVLVVYFYYIHPRMIGIETTPLDDVVDAPPGISERKKYLGSSSIYSGGFRDNLTGILTSGDGEIVGKVTADDEPVSGLKLRLALNGGVYSQWATTDEDGKYVISVPFGEYKVDGFELNTHSANRVLVGKIDHPLNSHFSSKFWVTAGAKGRGPTFRFVDPVEKSLPKNSYSVAEEVVLSWEPYPGASKYAVQIYEQPDPYSFKGRKRLFEWSDKPEVAATSYNLKEHGVELKQGHFYVFQVDALDEYGAMLSETYDLYPGYDFEVAPD